MYQHAHAVDGLGAGQPRLSQQLRLRGPVDQVAGQEVGRKGQRVWPERRFFVRPHAHGGGVDQEVGVKGFLGEGIVVEAAAIEGAGGNGGSQVLHQQFGPGQGAVEDGHLRAGSGQRVDDRPCPAPGAQHQRSPAAWLETSFPQIGEEPHPVGVVPRQPPIFPHDNGVHRSDGLRGLGDAVEIGHHRLFVGHGHVGPAKAQGHHAPQRGLHLAGRHGQGQVDPVQAQGGKGGVVHGRRQRVLHRPAHDPQELRLSVDLDHVMPPPSRRSVAAKPGNESAMHSTSHTRVWPAARSPATASVMARR